MADRDEIKELIREQADIVDVVGEFVDLKRAGKNFVGLCPFHDEKTPSFTVFPDRNIFKCFGCGIAGDIYSFLTEYHGISFPEAMEILGRRLGIDVPKSGKTDKSREKAGKRDAAIKVLEKASGFYSQMLETKEGKVAREFFQNRGFTKDTIEKFALGYAPDSWDATNKFLQKKGFTEEAMEDAGLIVKKESGGFYDRFRGRPVFTIRDSLGHVVGFGARAIREDDKLGKYINSPQSVIFDKSKLLYGYFEGKNEIRNSRTALMVEGYADVISLHQHGFENAVASSGTSLTKEQLGLLKNICRKLYFVYDSDEAGVKAAERGLEMALEEGYEVFVVRLPKGEDPDSFVRDHGKNMFDVYLRDALPFIDFKVMIYKENELLDTPAGKSEAARDLISLISKIPDELQHDFYIRRMTAFFDLQESQLRKIYQEKSRLVKKQKNRKQKTSLRQAPPKESAKRAGRKQDKKPDSAASEKEIEEILPEEKEIFQVILSGEDALEIFFAEFDIDEEQFITAEAQRLYRILLENLNSEADPLNTILSAEEISEQDKSILSDIALSRPVISEKWDKYGHYEFQYDPQRIIADSLCRLEMKRIEKNITMIQGKLRKNLDIEEQTELLDVMFFKSPGLAGDKLRASAIAVGLAKPPR